MADRLDEIQARVNAATPGPWHMAIFCDDHGEDEDYANIESFAQSDIAQRVLNNDAIFISNARVDTPFLLSEIARLREELRDVWDDREKGRDRVDG